jgi:hypothetical protein
MRPIRNASLLLAVALSIVGCSTRRSTESSTATSTDSWSSKPRRLSAVAATSPSPASTIMADEESVQPARQLVRNVALAMVVTDLEASIARIRAIGDSSGGYISHLEAGGEAPATRAIVDLRIPAARLDPAVDAIKRLAREVTREAGSLEDVTTQVVDLDAHLRTLRATESELFQLLAETRRRGGKTEDILTIHRELTGIREQIEQLQGRREMLGRQVAMATLHVELLTAPADQPLATGGWHPLDAVRHSFNGLLVVLRGMVDLGIYLVIMVAPVALVILVPAAWITRAWRRRRVATSSGAVET